MKVFRFSLGSELPVGPRIVAVGSFDGVHLGHQAVLKRATELAKKYQASSAALTFDPPPGIFFNHSGKQRLLTTLEQKTRLMEQMALDEMVILDFNNSVAKLSPERFARRILKEGLDALIIICGPGHRFGAGGAGDCLSLVSAGLSLSAEIVPPVNYLGQAISSTRVRELVENADLEAATQCLGRPYSIIGTQVQGQGKGASLGFPTVNLRWDPIQQMPPVGVYACLAAATSVMGTGALLTSPHQANAPATRTGTKPPETVCSRGISAGRRFTLSEVEGWESLGLNWTAASLGTKPTFEGSDLLLELHFIDGPPASEPGQTYEVFFARRLRDQIRFETEEALKEQIARDCAEVRKLAGSE